MEPVTEQDIIAFYYDTDIDSELRQRVKRWKQKKQGFNSHPPKMNKADVESFEYKGHEFRQTRSPYTRAVWGSDTICNTYVDIPDGARILSIRRTSDNKVFGVGDENLHGTIARFGRAVYDTWLALYCDGTRQWIDDIIERVPSKSYKVLRFRHRGVGYWKVGATFNRINNGDYCSEAVLRTVPPNAEILSVERATDHEVFNVGDETADGTIAKFDVAGQDVVRVAFTRRGLSTRLDSVAKVKHINPYDAPLFSLNEIFKRSLVGANAQEKLINLMNEKLKNGHKGNV